jgi:long-subunit acyl-CoA synthetase (AMP-forming)
MAAVPAIMERLKGAVEDKLKKSSRLKQAFFRTLYELKRRDLLAGHSSQLWDKLLFQVMDPMFEPDVPC